MNLRRRPKTETEQWRRDVACAIIRQYARRISVETLVDLDDVTAAEWCLDWFGQGVDVTVATINEVQGRARLAARAVLAS